MPKYALKDVYITGYNLGGSSSSEPSDSFVFKTTAPAPSTDMPLKFDGVEGEHADPLPAEGLTMNYERIEWTYDEGTGYTATDDLWI